jgi:hypothetical protein
MFSTMYTASDILIITNRQKDRKSTANHGYQCPHVMFLALQLQVSNADGSVTMSGWSEPVQLGDTPFQQALANLSWGRAVINIYTANFPEPADPMGCCNNAEVLPPAL